MVDEVSETNARETACRSADLQKAGRFEQYYADVSLQPATRARFEATKSAVCAAAECLGVMPKTWRVADIGCGVGAQCALWAADGHSVAGVDINETLVDVGRGRIAQGSLAIDLQVGTATALPWASETFDVCLAPEILEHVVDWQLCLSEAIRILKPGGILYLSTTNSLCPVQDEFSLPGYSWYPAALKRYFARRATTTWPDLVNHAEYPAVNWFTYFELQSYLARLHFTCLDRFDVAAHRAQAAIPKAVLHLVKSVRAIRLVGHVFTPYTVIFARKSL